MVCRSHRIFIRDYNLQYTAFLSLNNKESVIVSTAIPVTPVLAMLVH